VGSLAVGPNMILCRFHKEDRPGFGRGEKHVESKSEDYELSHIAKKHKSQKNKLA